MLLVDVSNVLHTTGVLPPDLAGIDLDGLIRLLGHSRYRRHRTLLVCDGGPPRRRSGHPASSHAHLEILYSGREREADDLLLERISASPHIHGRARAILVSSDRRIRTAAERRGLATLTSDAFVSQLAADHAHAPIRKQAAERNSRPVFAQQIPLPALEVSVWVTALLGRQTPPAPKRTASPSTASPSTSRSPAPHPPTPTAPADTPGLSPQDEARLRDLLIRARIATTGSAAAPGHSATPRHKTTRPASPAHVPRASGRPNTPPDSQTDTQANTPHAGSGPLLLLDPDLAKLLQDFSLTLTKTDLDSIMHAAAQTKPPPRPATPPRARKHT